MVDFHLKEGEGGVEEVASEVEEGQIHCLEGPVVEGEVEGVAGSAMARMEMACR